MQTSFVFEQIDRVERLRSVSDLSEAEWLDLLGMSWHGYRRFMAGTRTLPGKSYERMARYFRLDEQSLVEGKVDFKELIRDFSRQRMPEEFLVGAHGRSRTTITSLEYLEGQFGWRLKDDLLRRFGVGAAALQDAFAPISIRLITQICDHLHKRLFREQDFFAMGAYSYEGNRHSVVAQSLRDVESLEELYTRFFNEVIWLFERNCHYHYEQLSPRQGLLTSKTIPDVAQALEVRHVGSEQICHLKAGMWASLPAYIGLPMAKVTRLSCEHRGDDACRLLIETRTPVQAARGSLSA
ncbi:MAG: hypothetical protein KF802_03615 [Bdellovibrionaceae bacterium]|nr:hypothetical protein [Pseudobdellovibrionaceae bacterium]MBX3033290.1 hypothetical protein [Pseudobdellovibrionaceae bacterium]